MCGFAVYEALEGRANVPVCQSDMRWRGLVRDGRRCDGWARAMMGPSDGRCDGRMYSLHVDDLRTD